MQKNKVVIIGASSTIAQAIAEQYINQAASIVLISRNESKLCGSNITHIQQSNYEEPAIDLAVNTLSDIDDLPITRVFICNGVLHGEDFHPEKKLEDLSAVAFNQVLMANALTPILWLKKLTPLLSKKSTREVTCKITIFSARVGSISDNKLGGWYSYRASKAALNMLIQTTAIEFSRRAKNIKLIAFHPGTTDTGLSKPFQKNVPSDKLFTPEFVAQQLIKITDETPVDGCASFLDWQGKNIQW